MKINYKNNFLKIILAASVALGASSIASADTYAQQLAYSQFAPKTQTTYKPLGNYTYSVNDTRQVGSKMEVYGGNLMKVSGVAGLGRLSSSNPLLLNATIIGTGTGAIVSLVGSGAKYAVADIPKKALVKQEVSFKWIDPEQLSYSVMSKTWVELDGKRISDIKTSYNNTQI